MHRCGLAVLLALTLSIKIASGHSPGLGATALNDPEIETARGETAAFLVRNGFAVEEWWGDDDVRLASAQRRDCRLLIGPLSPIKWSRDLLHQLAPVDGRAFFVFNGSVYDDQPRWRSWMAYFWRRTALLVGLKVRYEPLFGAVALDTCRDLKVPWTALGS